jgi:hypothetical protein
MASRTLRSLPSGSQDKQSTGWLRRITQKTTAFKPCEALLLSSFDPEDKGESRYILRVKEAWSKDILNVCTKNTKLL